MHEINLTPSRRASFFVIKRPLRAHHASLQYFLYHIAYEEYMLYCIHN